MTPISRKLSLIPLLLILCAGLHAQAEENMSNQPHLRASVNIASEPDYPPFCMVDENGEATGFSVELFQAAAEAVGLAVHIRIGVWNRIKADLATGRIDALPLVGRTPEREALFDFSMPYLSLHGAVFVRKETRSIHSPADLEGKHVAVMKGDNAEEFLRREKIAAEISTTHTFEEAFRELEKGNADAVVTQRVMGLHLLRKLGISSIHPLDFQLPQFRQDFCFAVRKGDRPLLQRLNEGLSIVIANDTYQRIRDQWLGPDEERKRSFWEVLRIVLYFLVPLLLMIALGTLFILRKEVKRRTRELHREIAERKKSEADLRRIADNVTDVVFATDLNLNTTYISPSVQNLVGIPAADYIHKNAKERHPPQTLQKMQSLLQEELKKEKNPGIAKGRTLIIEGEHYTVDGGIIAVSMHVSFIRDETGRPIGLLGVTSDITERKRSERELRKLKDELEIKVAERTRELSEKVGKLDKSQRAMLYMVEDLNAITNELKDERGRLEESYREMEAFSYSVSHDLRAPLRAIEGFSRFLQEDYAEKLDDEGKRFIETIRQNTVKMDTLISELLNLSRTSRQSIKTTSVNMKALVESILEQTFDEKDTREFAVTIDALPRASCDIELVKQIWVNLIGNALKYTSGSQVKKIRIGGREEGNNAVYFIRDTGVGFDGRYKEKLFGVFQRLHPERDFKGTGVGLAIVQRIVHRHGGRVWAEGEPGKGATFFFTLPADINTKETADEHI
ncbi:MAG TPA: transporter substrate-binding domain-containing protein [Candidatus Aminicenantes bacterium]|nr:transporter substrate-binding domain-containing protein [Candidatus Aminicenantes bacterium]